MSLGQYQNSGHNSHDKQTWQLTGNEKEGLLASVSTNLPGKSCEPKWKDKLKMERQVLGLLNGSVC